MGAMKKLLGDLESLTCEQTKALEIANRICAGDVSLDDGFKEAKKFYLDSFSVDQQCEDHSYEIDQPYEDAEIILVDATADGVEDEFRLVKVNGRFFLEHWDERDLEWSIQQSLTPVEVIKKLQAVVV